jgi:hypothetical protein
VFEVIVSLEEGVPSTEFDEDTPDRPNVAGKAPAVVHDDFWGAVVARAYKVGVVLVVEGCAAEIDYPDFGVAEDFFGAVTTLRG